MFISYQMAWSSFDLQWMIKVWLSLTSDHQGAMQTHYSQRTLSANRI